MCTMCYDGGVWGLSVQCVLFVLQLLYYSAYNVCLLTLYNSVYVDADADAACSNYYAGWCVCCYTGNMLVIVYTYCYYKHITSYMC